MSSASSARLTSTPLVPPTGPAGYAPAVAARGCSATRVSPRSPAAPTPSPRTAGSTMNPSDQTGLVLRVPVDTARALGEPDLHDALREHLEKANPRSWDVTADVALDWLCDQ